MLERELGGRRLRGLVVAGVSLASLSALSVLAGASWAAVSSSSANQNQYGGKAVICHHTHSKTNPWVTITVSQAALKAHLRQGGYARCLLDLDARPRTRPRTRPSDLSLRAVETSAG